MGPRTTSEDHLMDLLILTTLLTGGLAALGLASHRWGIDSRDRIADDHRR